MIAHSQALLPIGQRDELFAQHYVLSQDPHHAKHVWMDGIRTAHGKLNEALNALREANEACEKARQHNEAFGLLPEERAVRRFGETVETRSNCAKSVLP